MRGLPAVVALLSLVITAGCDHNFGTGGTGEYVVPQGTLRTIQQSRMEDLATTRPSTQPATMPTTAPAELSITLDEVRQIALVNNLDLKVELLNPTIARESISQEQARFESVFTAGTTYTTTDSPTASELTSSQAKDWQSDAGVRVPLRTGGTLNFDVPIDGLETNSQFSTLNPAYTSDFSASISHPLLRGFGTDVNSHAIRVAFYQYQQSQARTKLEMIRVLANADRVYWRLYAARRELEVRKKEYDLAVAQLDRARRQARNGVIAEVDVVRAESGVADRIEAIIVAENNLRNSQRDLKRTLNKPGLDMNSPTIVIPASEPRPVYYKIDPQQLVEVALKQRMEMLDLELQILAESSSVRFARNDMLPLVTLNYTYNVNGLGSALDDSLNMLSRKNYEDHQIGIRLEVPIGNEAARSRLRRALASRLQQLQTKEQRQAQIRQEVLNAADTLETNWQRILAAQKRTILAARTLDVEIRQFNQGLRTSTDVLQAQAQLANAQSSEIAAVTEYQIAQVDIAFATGTLLGASNIQWAPAPTPKP